MVATSSFVGEKAFKNKFKHNKYILNKYIDKHWFDLNLAK